MTGFPEGTPADRARNTLIEETSVQLSHSTKVDRYPLVFAATVQLMEAAGIARPHILSYGSSSGEEPHTLATRYFPEATVLGLDVADPVIAQARATYGANERLQFENARAYQPAAESFDIIFAMSVLCRWPETREMDDIAAVFPFANFARQTAYLDTLLKPGGFLVIYNASYSFLHAEASAGYDLIVHPRVRTAGFVRRFAPDGRYDAASTGTDCLYRKRPVDERLGRRGLVIRSHALRELGRIERDIAL